MLPGSWCEAFSVDNKGCALAGAPLPFVALYLSLCHVFFRSHAVFLSFRPISLHSNEAYALITAIIGDNAAVCLQMKAAEMRGRLDATEKRSSEPFNLFYWFPSNVTPKQTRLDTTEFHLPSRVRKHQLTTGSVCVYEVQLDIYQMAFKLDTALSSWED